MLHRKSSGRPSSLTSAFGTNSKHYNTETLLCTNIPEVLLPTQVLREGRSAVSRLGEASGHPTVSSEACVDPLAELSPKSAYPSALPLPKPLQEKKKGRDPSCQRQKSSLESTSMSNAVAPGVIFSFLKSSKLI
ncbi:hypothetical protein AV530_019385 [Patagioenas fasciata monilis]|uniref:Uncharacterized protein n=1 Tax=Patagioenas fasciata monilis TaxID=372326 RepID=A0A1V4JD55_PATFA|nr:hypothetical protein AV530_019385 [Patagioenas fasciata monilis]